MSVGANDRLIQYTASGGQTIFPYDFYIGASSWLKVYQNGTLLIEATHYTVSGVGSGSGGNVTLVTGATASDAITIVGETPVTRSTTLTDDLLAASLNSELDAPFYRAQEADRVIDRYGIRAPWYDVLTDGSMVLPAAATRASKVLGFTSDGKSVELYSTTGAGSGHTHGQSIANIDTATAFVIANLATLTTVVGGYAALASSVSSLSTEVSNAREGAASIGEAVARKLNDAPNNAILSGGTISGTSAGGTTCDVAAIAAVVNGYYNATSGSTNVTGLNAGLLNYVYLTAATYPATTPTFGSNTTGASASGRVYIGTVDGATGTVTQYAAKARWKSAWTSLAIAAETTLTHNLGFVPNPNEIFVLCSASSGGSDPFISWTDLSGGNHNGVCVRDITATTVGVVAGATRAELRLKSVADGTNVADTALNPVYVQVCIVRNPTGAVT